jgi:hypothetical protein
MHAEARDLSRLLVWNILASAFFALAARLWDWARLPPVRLFHRSSGLFRVLRVGAILGVVTPRMEPAAGPGNRHFDLRCRRRRCDIAA